MKALCVPILEILDHVIRRVDSRGEGRGGPDPPKICIGGVERVKDPQ